jgi:hypothetical protein
VPLSALGAPRRPVKSPDVPLIVLLRGSGQDRLLSVSCLFLDAVHGLTTVP